VSLQCADDNLIWIDLEMTGLDTQYDYIIEIATVVTDTQLQNLVEGPVLAIHQSESILSGMDEWNTRQHTQSGLLQRVHDSPFSVAEAEAQTLQFLKRYAVAGKSPMCGNSICQDRRFLARLMSNLEAFFHYRNLDVSTLKILAQRWYPDLPGFSKKASHLALADIHDSINELQHYRQHMLQTPKPNTISA